MHLRFGNTRSRTIFAETTIRDTAVTETAATRIETVVWLLSRYTLPTILWRLKMGVIMKNKLMIMPHTIHVVMMSEISNHFIELLHFITFFFSIVLNWIFYYYLRLFQFTTQMKGITSQYHFIIIVSIFIIYFFDVCEKK